MPRASKAKTEDAEAVDQKPYPTTPTKKKASSEQGSPSKNGKSNPWTPEETWNLFSAIYVKRDNLNWDEVAKAVGRDKKSCMNRFDRNIRKNLQDRVGTC